MEANLRIALVQNRTPWLALAAAALLIGFGLVSPNAALANHPVLVEGNNCSNDPPSTTIVPPGTCGDYDGDGRIGTAEDTDNADDRIFGTIRAALGPDNGGANQNGRVTIVTSGRFAEGVRITGGNVILEAAPGVEANIDAVLQGDPGNVGRQGAPGIIVSSPPDRVVVIRNIVSRNWTEGIRVVGQARVTIDHCRMDGNTNFGIRVMDDARVAITNTHVNGTGFRAAPGVDNTPNPGIGIGISFEGISDGSIFFSSVTHSFAAGISDTTAPTGPDLRRRSPEIFAVQLFDNNPDLVRTTNGRKRE